MKKIFLILALICMMVLPVFSQSGNYTVNGYFYLPLYGAYGLDEYNAYNAAMEGADYQIGLNKTSGGDENIQDVVGIMFSDNTEIFCDLAYQDVDGTVDVVVPVKDEDDMASDSATYLATQQSIKAYADTLHALQYLKTEINTLSKVETIYSKDITDSTELAAALGAFTGSANIVTLGTIGTGIWQGTAIADEYIPNDITIDLATLATTITVTDNEDTVENNPICFVAGADPDGGSLGIETDGDLHYNPSTGLVTATGFAGALTGNVTGNADTVTGFTPASGSLTLAGADALTLTTTAATNVTLPTSGIVVSDATACTDLEGTLLSIATGTLNAAIPEDHITATMLKDDNTPADEDIFSYEATGTTGHWYSRSEVGIGTATSITDNLILEADLNADEEPADNDILTFDTTGANFSWQTPAELSLAAVNQTMYIGTTGVAINRGSAALTLAGITLTTPDIGTPSAGILTNCTFPTLNQNTTGTAANLSGTPALPNGTTATTQAGSDNSTKLATTAYADAAAAGGGGADVNLSNIESVAIPVDLLSDTADTDSLGSATKEWLNLYLGDNGKAYFGIGQDVSLNRSAANTLYVTASSGTSFTGKVTAVGSFDIGDATVNEAALEKLESTTSTYTQLNYLAAATGTTGTTSTNVVFSTSPTLVTPILGTPTSGTLTNCTGLPIATGVSGLGANVATFLATPSSANLASAVTDETGSGLLVFGTSPNITTPTGIVKGDVGLGNVENLKVKLDGTAAPAAATDDITLGYAVGSRWFDVTNDKEYVCLDNTDGAAVWTETTGAGGGASTFTGLTDTPANFTSSAGKTLKVNSTPDAVEFANDTQITSKTTTATLTVAEQGTILVSAASAYTITLPTAVGNTGLTYHFKKTDANYNLITIDGDGTETLNYENSTSAPVQTYSRLNTYGAEVTVVSDGANWQVYDEALGQVPEFLAYLGTTQTNITDTTHTVINIDTEEYDIGSNFNTTTHQFTVPISGKYAIAIGVDFLSTSVLADGSYACYIRTTDPTYIVQLCGQASVAAKVLGLAGSKIRAFTKDNVIETTVYLDVGANTVDINGGTSYMTWFQMKLVSKD